MCIFMRIHWDHFRFWDSIVKVRALDDGHEVPISNAWMHSDYPDIAFVDLGPDPVLPDPVDYVLEVEMAE